MAKIDLYDPKWVDMVFAGKNQAYGAYVLRKGTSSRNIKALLILICAAVLIGGFLGYLVWKNKHDAELLAEYNQKMELKALQEAQKEAEKQKDKPKPKPKIEPEKIVPEVKSTKVNTVPVIKEDDKVVESKMMQTMEKLVDDKRSSGVEEVKGTDNATAVAAAPTVATPAEVAPPPPPVKKEEPKPEVKEVENKIFTVAEQMPSFKGNVNSWLSSHLQYPAVAAENGIQGRVIVKFVVGKDGSVSQAQVVRGVDPALDREALRVVNSMPRWNPGMNNGQPANVWFTLPINFKLQ